MIFTGGFYSDTKAFVGDSCLKCPNGTFVDYNKSPGKSPSDCTACPQGKTDRCNAITWFVLYPFKLIGVRKN